jgi:hypothetical protein
VLSAFIRRVGPISGTRGASSARDWNEDEHATEDGELSSLVMEASNALFDLRMLPIRDIPQLPKTAQEIMAAVGLIL